MKEKMIIRLGFLCILTFVSTTIATPQSPLPDSIRSVFYFPKKVNPTAMPVQIKTVNPQDPQNVTFQQPTPLEIPNLLVVPHLPDASMPAPQVGDHLIQFTQKRNFLGTTPTLPALGTSFSTSTSTMSQGGMGQLFQGSLGGQSN